MPESPRTIFVGFQDAEQAEKDRDIFQARLIKRDGSVKVPNRAQWVYYLPLAGGQPGQAYNLARVLEQEDIQVIIGHPSNNTNTICVLRKDPDLMQDNTQLSPDFAQHGRDHRYLGPDSYLIDERSFEPLSMLPKGTFTVKVLGGRYNAFNTTKYFISASLDLTAFQPPTTGKRVIGLYIDRTNTLQSVVGGLVAEAPGVVAPPPVWPGNIFKVGFVVLYASKSFIDKEDVKNLKVMWTEAPLSYLTFHVFS